MLVELLSNQNLSTSQVQSHYRFHPMYQIVLHLQSSTLKRLQGPVNQVGLNLHLELGFEDVHLDYLFARLIRKDEKQYWWCGGLNHALDRQEGQKDQLELVTLLDSSFATILKDNQILKYFCFSPSFTKCNPKFDSREQYYLTLY